MSAIADDEGDHVDRVLPPRQHDDVVVVVVVDVVGDPVRSAPLPRQ